MGIVINDPSDQTICALSTPHGRGGISVIRVSGPQSLLITRKIASFLPNKPESHRIYFGTLKDQNNYPIDEVLISYFKENTSYTGQETIEISCHGSPVLVEIILNLLIQFGCRPATRGEFTYRAFMNGRINLIQSEGVLALIESQSRESARQSVKQLKGSTSNEISQIESDLVKILAHIEASIDFSLENLETMKGPEISNGLSKIRARLEKLTQSYTTGRKIRDGIDVVLCGSPNVGKSSLMNLLYGDQKSIVTDSPGTTRDLIEAQIYINGRLFNFFDTAGLRKTTDKVEAIGVELSHQKIKEADLTLFLIDSSQKVTNEELEFLNNLEPQTTIIVFNKIDLISANKDSLLRELFSQLKGSLFVQKIPDQNQYLLNKTITISTSYEKSKDELFDIIAAVTNEHFQSQDALIMHERHFDGLNKALSNLKQAENNSQSGVSSEIIALDLHEAILKLQEVIGTRYDDKLLDKIFKEFCLGK